MNHLEWIKANQKALIDKILSSIDMKRNGSPMAIFMAGLPGAGKTELSQGLVEQSFPRPLRIDMDELATMISGYTPEKANEFREAATRLLNALFDRVIKNRADFIMDGTFGSKKAILNVNRALKRGYQVKVIFSSQDPKLAWEFTRAREKVEHRAISESGFLDSYYKTIDNLRELSKMKYSNVSIDIFVKSKDNTVEKQFTNVEYEEIDNIIKVIYNKDKLKAYIESKK